MPKRPLCFWAALMIRLIGSIVLSLAVGCTAPLTTPEQLIVGAWTCKMSDMPPPTTFLVTFTDDGRMRLEVDGSMMGDGLPMTTRLEGSGHYQLLSGGLKAVLDVVNIQRLSVAGEVIAPEEFPAFADRIARITSDASAVPITTLDDGQLIIKPAAEGSLMSCARQSGKQ